VDVRAAGVTSIATAILLASCWPGAAPPAPETSECRRIEISSKGYRMLVPKGSGVEEDKARGSVLIRPKPNGRLVTFMSIAPLAGATLPPPEDSATLANGLELSYVADDDIGGGSGGPEAELVGETLLDKQTPLMIVCHNQREGGADAKWCLEYLGTLTPEGSAEACR
jgi:hypothetical protein